MFGALMIGRRNGQVNQLIIFKNFKASLWKLKKLFNKLNI